MAEKSSQAFQHLLLGVELTVVVTMELHKVYLRWLAARSNP